MPNISKIPVKKKKLKKKTNLPTLKKTKKVKPTKLLTKPRTVRSKENTLAYYDCLIQQITNTEGVKITKICNWCRGNKDKVAWSKSESKKELVDKVAKSYLEFGQGLGHLLHANVVKECKCK